MNENNNGDRILLGIALMALAAFIIPLSDGAAKQLSLQYSSIFVSWMRYVSSTLVIVPVAFFLRGRNILPKENLASHSLRTVFLVCAMTLYFSALARIPMATAASAFFVSPVITVVLSFFILKERLSLTKVISLSLGFLGALIILRPEQSLNLGVILAFGAGVCHACYIITMRFSVQKSDPVQTLVFQSILGTVLITPYLFYAGEAISFSDLKYCLAMGIFASLFHGCMVYACRYAPASILAPIGYLELVSTALVGYLFFFEIPSSTTVIGAIFIILAGIILTRFPRGRLR